MNGFIVYKPWFSIYVDAGQWVLEISTTVNCRRYCLSINDVVFNEKRSVWQRKWFHCFSYNVGIPK